MMRNARRFAVRIVSSGHVVGARASSEGKGWKRVLDVVRRGHVGTQSLLPDEALFNGLCRTASVLLLERWAPPRTGCQGAEAFVALLSIMASRDCSWLVRKWAGRDDFDTYVFGTGQSWCKRPNLGPRHCGIFGEMCGDKRLTERLETNSCPAPCVVTAYACCSFQQALRWSSSGSLGLDGGVFIFVCVFARQNNLLSLSVNPSGVRPKLSKLADTDTALRMRHSCSQWGCSSLLETSCTFGSRLCVAVGQYVCPNGRESSA